MASERVRSFSVDSCIRQRPRIVARLSCIRFTEVLLLQATPFMGLVIGTGAFTLSWGFTALHLILASMSLIAYVFCLNDLAGLASDLNDPHKAGRTFSAKGITTDGMVWLAVLFGLISLVLLSFLSLPALALGCVLIALGLLYSFPNGGAKGVPLLSSGFHVVGGITHFLLGYGAVTQLDARGVLLGLYFGLVFAAGHLNQEVRDYESDQRNRILTNAVRFGKRHAFVAGFLLFTASYGVLGALATARVLPPVLVWVLMLYPVHAVLFWTSYRGDLSHEAVLRHQRQYRVLHVVIGIVLIAAWTGSV